MPFFGGGGGGLGNTKGKFNVASPILLHLHLRLHMGTSTSSFTWAHKYLGASTYLLLLLWKSAGTSSLGTCSKRLSVGLGSDPLIVLPRLPRLPDDAQTHNNQPPPNLFIEVYWAETIRPMAVHVLRPQRSTGDLPPAWFGLTPSLARPAINSAAPWALGLAYWGYYVYACVRRRGAYSPRLSQASRQSHYLARPSGCGCIYSGVQHPAAARVDISLMNPKAVTTIGGRAYQVLRQYVCYSYSAACKGSTCVISCTVALNLRVSSVEALGYEAQLKAALTVRGVTPSCGMAVAVAFAFSNITRLVSRSLGDSFSLVVWSGGSGASKPSALLR